MFQVAFSTADSKHLTLRAQSAARLSPLLAEDCYCRSLQTAAPGAPRPSPLSTLQQRKTSGSFLLIPPRSIIKPCWAACACCSRAAGHGGSLPAAARQEPPGPRFLALVVKSAEKSRGLEWLWILRSKKEEGAWKRKGWGARMCDMSKIFAFKQCSVASGVKWFIPKNFSSCPVAGAKQQAGARLHTHSSRWHFILLNFLFFFNQVHFSSCKHIPLVRVQLQSGSSFPKIKIKKIPTKNYSHTVSFSFAAALPHDGRAHTNECWHA